MNSTQNATPQPLAQDVIEGSLALIQEVFKKYRPLVLERAGKVSFSDKEDGSPVTDTDVEIEKGLQAALASRYPDLPVFGEETGYGDDLPPACWLVDPIDGTKSFVAGVPAFTGMAVLIVNEEAIAGVIYNTSTDVMYVAQKGKGAYKNGVRINLSEIPLAEVAYCKGRFIEALDAILKDKKVTCKTGPEGGGFGFTMVLDGLSAARFNLMSRGYIHDYAPGALLVREAGGAILPIMEDEYTYKTRTFVACHPELKETLQAQLPNLRELEITLRDKK